MATVERIGCGTPVTWGHHKKTCGQWLYEKSSNYLNVNGKVAKVLQGHAKNGAQAVEFMDRPSSCCVTALKVISYATIIFPLLALIVRTVLGICYKFYLLSPKELDAIRTEGEAKAAAVGAINKQKELDKQLKRQESLKDLARRVKIHQKRGRESVGTLKVPVKISPAEDRAATASAQAETKEAVAAAGAGTGVSVVVVEASHAPKLLASYKPDPEKELSLEIYEHGEALWVFRRTGVEADAGEWDTSVPILDYVWTICQANTDSSISPIDVKLASLIESLLLHKAFQPYLNEFINKSFTFDSNDAEEGYAKWCDFSVPAALAILRACVKMNMLENPLSVIDPRLGRNWNFFTHAAANENEELLNGALLNGIIEIFPKAFQEAGPQILETLLDNKHKHLIEPIRAKLRA